LPQLLPSALALRNGPNIAIFGYRQ
jgi:hypothetical protein